MDKRILVPIMALLAPVSASAADISGFVRNADNQTVPGVAVVYVCSGNSYPGKTNGYGRYRIRGIPNMTWCNVTVGGVETSTRINSGSGSKEVDLRI